MEKTDAIEAIITEVFTMEKLRDDVRAYLEDVFEEKFREGKYEIPVFSWDGSGETQLMMISSEDLSIHLSTIVVHRFFRGIDYQVEVGFGEYDRERLAHPLTSIEKCFGMLYYNPDFSLYSIEFLDFLK